MNNKIYNIGDSLIVAVKPKQNGTAIISGFTDTIEGGEVTREYRIIEDEMFYSDWHLLDNNTINGVKIKQNNTVEVRYTCTKKTAEYVEFKSIELEGDFEPEIINSPILNSSMFSNIAWTDETEALAKNLFKKLYFRGIIPTYILRGDNIDVDEDEDYITLFYTIAKFFAIILRFFQRFENFFEDEEMMREWIRQNGIYFDESNITLEQLQHLARHFYNEIRNRGTKMIFNRQGDVVNDVSNDIDGEFIRLIRSTPKDELMYEHMSLSNIGWCLRQSSPLYRGTLFSEKLNKTKEATKDFQDVSNFQTFAQRNSTVSIVTENNLIIEEPIDPFLPLSEIESDNIPSRQPNYIVGGIIARPELISTMTKRVLQLKTTGKSACGLGRYNEDDKITNIYTADPDLDYEITFMFKPISIGKNAKLHFGVEVFNGSKDKLENALITANGNQITDMFFDELPLTNFQERKWYFVRGIIHAYSSDIIENVQLNIGFGNQLTFNNKFVKFMLPKIYMSCDNSTSMYVWDYKIRPLVRGTNILPLKNGRVNSHSLGFIQAPRIFYSYFRNNNNSQSREEITDIIERYLLPFNMTNIFQFIDNETTYE